jgi:hypothetical protein
MNKFNDNNNKIQIKDFKDSKNEVKRKIGRPPFIKTDKTIFKKEKKIEIICHSIMKELEKLLQWLKIRIMIK